MTASDRCQLLSCTTALHVTTQGCVVQVTAAEYTRLYLSALQETLDRYPPPQPSEAAVNLLVTVGQQQEFLLWHSLLPPPGHPGSLDALEVTHPPARTAPPWTLTGLLLPGRCQSPC